MSTEPGEDHLDGKLKPGETDVPNREGRPDELAFMLASRRIVHQCLTALWEDRTSPVEGLVARSNWLWSALRQEQPMRVLPGGDDSGWLLAALNIAALMASVVYLGPGPWNAALPYRKALMDWIDETAIKPRVDSGADQFLDLIAHHIASLADNELAPDLAQQLGVGLKAAEAQLGLQRRRIFDLAPESIQRRLLDNRAFMADSGVGRISRMTMNGIDFPAQPLWAAITRALRNGAAA